jgi:hypothetical protein
MFLNPSPGYIAPTGLSGVTDFNGDLYGIGFQTSTTPIKKYYEADNDPDVNVALLQNNILTPSVVSGSPSFPLPVDTSDTALTGGDALLGNYIQAFYTANPTYAGGTYVFLRVNPDVNLAGSTNNNGYVPGGAPLSGADTVTDNAILTLTTVPEPSSFAAAGVAAFAFLGRRRRQK